MKLKRLSAILITLSIMFLTGCWSSREINTLAISVCMGIDKIGDDYMVTEQIINPRTIASKKGSNDAPVTIYTETGKDILKVLRKLTTECPRKIYASHLRMVVVGEVAAKEGIQHFIDFIARDHEFRTDFFFVVAKGTTANEILSTLTTIEAIPGIEMYNSLKTTEKNWAPSNVVRIIELVNAIVADGKNPVLTGIELSNGKKKPSSTNDLRLADIGQKPKYTGLGAFKKDKLVGWLTEEQSQAYNYIIGNVKSTVGYTNYGDDVKIAFEVTKAKSSIKASMENGKPAIDVEIIAKQNIGAVDGMFDVSKEENKKIINELSEKKIRRMCEEVVYTAQNDFKTDIFGFGEAIHRKYPKQWKKMKEDWDNSFKYLKVNITVTFETEKLGQITKPFFIKENE